MYIYTSIYCIYLHKHLKANIQRSEVFHICKLMVK